MPDRSHFMLRQYGYYEAAADSHSIGNTPLSSAQLCSLTVTGKTVQTGTPTPDSPVDIQCVGAGTVLRSRSTDGSKSGGTLTVPCDLYEGDVWCPETGSVTGNFYVRTFTGTESWVNGGTYTFTSLSPTALPSGSNNLAVNAVCTHLVGTYQNNIINAEGHFAINGTAGNAFFTRLGGAFADVAAWKAFLAAQYGAGTPVTVVYALPAPVPSSYSAQSVLRTVPGLTVLDSVPAEGNVAPTLTVRAAVKRTS